MENERVNERADNLLEPERLEPERLEQTRDTTYECNHRSRMSDSDSGLKVGSTDQDQPDKQYAEYNTPENVIDNIYKSMSKIIEALNTDNVIINQQIKKIRADLEFVCNAVAGIKMENQDLVVTYTSEINNIVEQIQALAERRNDQAIIDDITTLRSLLTKMNTEIDTMKAGNLQKQILDTRTMLVQMMSTNIAAVKRDITDMKKIKEDIRPHIKAIIAEELRDYMSKMPSLDQKFEELAKEQRAYLSQHIRKSTVQRVSNDAGNLLELVKQQTAGLCSAADLETLRVQQQEFITRVEKAIGDLYANLNKLAK